MADNLKTVNKSKIDRLRDGEKVTCSACRNGVYVPSYGTPETTFIFKCTKCNSHINMTPGAAIVE